MTDLWALPDLGVGIVYWPGLANLWRLGELPIDVLEVEPQPFWFAPEIGGTAPFRLDERAFEHLRRQPGPKLVHGVGMPVGGTAPLDLRQLAAYVESVDALGAPWASEHLSFTRAGDGGPDLGFLLPPVQSPAGVAVAVANIRTVREQLPVPFAFETGVSYLRPRPGEMSDGEFFAAVARGADCGILLDLHNLWANERNGRQAVADLVDQLPLDRVVELHLAGGDEYAGYWVDAHSTLIPAPVLELARAVVPRLPNLKAVIYEVMPEYVAANGIRHEDVLEQLHEVRALWTLRGTAVVKPEVVRPAVRGGTGLPTPLEWEAALASAISGPRPAGTVLDDPGVDVIRTLVHAVRAGKIADTLTLTTRLLLLTLGDDGMRRVLEDFWAVVPSEPLAADEARNFGHHLRDSAIADEVGHLREVVTFELAVHDVLVTNEPRTVGFPVDPEVLLAHLRKGALPPPLVAGTFEVTLTPPVATDHDSPT
jgi:uncharacterized protein (UPF0276 family)